MNIMKAFVRFHFKDVTFYILQYIYERKFSLIKLSSLYQFRPPKDYGAFPHHENPNFHRYDLNLKGDSLRLEASGLFHAA